MRVNLNRDGLPLHGGMVRMVRLRFSLLFDLLSLTLAYSRLLSPYSRLLSPTVLPFFSFFSFLFSRLPSPFIHRNPGQCCLIVDTFCASNRAPFLSIRRFAFGRYRKRGIAAVATIQLLSMHSATRENATSFF